MNIGKQGSRKNAFNLKTAFTRDLPIFSLEEKLVTNNSGMNF